MSTAAVVVSILLGAPAADIPAGLGAPPAAFAARFGPPVKTTGTVQSFVRCLGSGATAQWDVMFDDGKAYLISRNACPPARHEPQAAADEASTFLPSDAKQLGTFQTDYGPANLYLSPSLGKLFPPAKFEDCDGKRRPSGTLFYLLTPQRQSWTLGVGQCP